MRLTYISCVLLQMCVLVIAQRTVLDTSPFLELYRNIRKTIFQTFGEQSSNGARFLKSAKEQQKIQELVSDSVPFPCDLKRARSIEVPTSVHRLRPGDIDVIAAMGDSLTAGVGILSTEVLQVPVENRGLSAGGGGEGTWRQYITLPNILKEFNPGLIGYAHGDSLTAEEDSQLNVGETGAMTEDMPYMAETLIKRIKKDPRINVKTHWKLIVLNIGSNDFCVNVCDRPSPSSILEEHKRNLLKVLRLLRDNLPRTLVVIASPPRIQNLVATNPQSRSFLCYVMTMVECSCMFALKYRQMRPTYFEIENKWYELETDVIGYPEFHSKDFEVVSAPCLRNSEIPQESNGQTDTSYFAADCFHISQQGNARYGNCLWNNLLEPIGKRTVRWTPLFQKFLCPTEKMPYLVTHGNTPE